MENLPFTELKFFIFFSTFSLNQTISYNQTIEANIYIYFLFISFPHSKDSLVEQRTPNRWRPILITPANQNENHHVYYLGKKHQFLPEKQSRKMGEEAKNSFQSIREWVVDHKLRTVGNLSLSLVIFCVYTCYICLFVYMGFWLLVWVFMGFGLNFSFVEGCLWLSGIAGSIAYNWSQPNMKTSVKIIHARYDNILTCLSTGPQPFGLKRKEWIGVSCQITRLDWQETDIF